jgi:hypothetical protein
VDIETKRHKNTKDNRDEVHETHSKIARCALLGYGRNEYV